MKSKIFEYELEIYKRQIIFAINVSYDKLMQYMVDVLEFPDDCITTEVITSGKCVLFSNGYHLLWVNTGLGKEYQQQVLVHELFHLTCHIMNDIGCMMDDSNQENYAYLQEYLFKIATGKKQQNIQP
jgi:Zn-dependent peptidase ImmA (M78 family)